MTRPHDMGGRFGDGSVVPEPEKPIFHADWHARALAVTLACGAFGKWNLDISRHARERLAPADYARFSYYEKWMSALANLLVEKGVVSRAELAAGTAAARSPLAERAWSAEQIPSILAAGGPVDRPATSEPKFAVGDRVRVRAQAENVRHAGGHTRLPAYAAGAVGKIVTLHGHHIFPDAHAHGDGEAPEPLYAVAIPAGALWAHPEHPGDEVVLDLWESYLLDPDDAA